MIGCFVSNRLSIFWNICVTLLQAVVFGFCFAWSIDFYLVKSPECNIDNAYWFKSIPTVAQTVWQSSLTLVTLTLRGEIQDGCPTAKLLEIVGCKCFWFNSHLRHGQKMYLTAIWCPENLGLWRMYLLISSDLYLKTYVIPDLTTHLDLQVNLSGILNLLSRLMILPYYYDRASTFKNNKDLQ